MERRFQPVMVNEPTVEDTISILRGLKERYEVFHGVKIQDAALIAAATLSDRYITDRFLPDKAIDLVDEACAMVTHRDGFDARRTGRDEPTASSNCRLRKPSLKKETDELSTAAPGCFGKGDWPSCATASTAMKAQWENEKNAVNKVQKSAC